jgi:hypothetical protein
MRTVFRSVILSALAGLSLATAAAAGGNLLGSWQCQGAGGSHSLTFQDANALVYDGERSSYALMPGVILVQEDNGVSPYAYQLTGDSLAIRFPDGKVLDCRRGVAAPKAGKTAAPAPAGRVDAAALQKEIAGTWWGYSGSTERKIGLCPDGSYRDFIERGYSGRSHDAGGQQTMAWGAASQGGNQGRWRIAGDYQSGVIEVQTMAGRQFTLTYRQVGEPGCLDISGNRLCRTSRHCE